jgi:hypothetical protein
MFERENLIANFVGFSQERPDLNEVCDKDYDKVQQANCERIHTSNDGYTHRNMPLVSPSNSSQCHDRRLVGIEQRLDQVGGIHCIQSMRRILRKKSAKPDAPVLDHG